MREGVGSGAPLLRGLWLFLSKELLFRSSTAGRHRGPLGRSGGPGRLGQLHTPSLNQVGAEGLAHWRSCTHTPSRARLQVLSAQDPGWHAKTSGARQPRW